MSNEEKKAYTTESEMSNLLGLKRVNQRFDLIRNTSTRSERKALLRQMLADLSVLAAVAENSVVHDDLMEVFGNVMKFYRSDDET